MLWWQYVLQALGTAFQATATTFNHTVANMGSREWSVVMGLTVVWGIFCMRGFGKRV